MSFWAYVAWATATNTPHTQPPMHAVHLAHGIAATAAPTTAPKEVAKAKISRVQCTPPQVAFSRTSESSSSTSSSSSHVLVVLQLVVLVFRQLAEEPSGKIIDQLVIWVRTTDSKSVRGTTSSPSAVRHA